MATEGSAQPDPAVVGGETLARTWERLQQELADTRAALQTEALQLGQLQEALETALQVARSVRLDPHTQLDRLAQELLESARAEAERIRQRAQEEAQARRAALEAELADLRARVERELATQRAAAERELAEQRAAFERQVQAAQAEFDRLTALLSSATQALAATRLASFTASRVQPAAVPEPSAPPAAPTASLATEAPSPPPTPEPVPPAPEITERVEPPAGTTGAPPMPEAGASPSPAVPTPPAASEVAPAPTPPSGEPGARLAAPASYHAACRLLDQGDVPGALDAFRGIVDREPEHVGPVIDRLVGMMQDANLRAHHEEIRLLLVDAYMVQGDYDRAMSLLHEPGG
jgi:hypothetical protein